MSTKYTEYNESTYTPGTTSPSNTLGNTPGSVSSSHSGSQVERSAEKVADETKSVANDVNQQARQAKDEAVAKVKSTASDLADQARQQAASVRADVQDKVESKATDQKVKATAQINSVASALRQTGKELRTQDQDNFAQYTDVAADQIERVSGYLEDRNIGELMNEVKRFANRQPEIFIAGSLAAGFFLGRFLRSSNEPTYQGAQRYQSRYAPGTPTSGGDYYQAEYPRQSYREQAYGEPAYTTPNQTSSDADATVYGPLNSSTYGDSANMSAGQDPSAYVTAVEVKKEGETK